MGKFTEASKGVLKICENRAQQYLEFFVSTGQTVDEWLEDKGLERWDGEAFAIYMLFASIVIPSVAIGAIGTVVVMARRR